MASRSLLVAVLLVTLPARASTQAISLTPPEAGARRDSVVQLAMAISGGASLGSYQSGVTWAMIEFWPTRHARYRLRAAPSFPAVLARIGRGSVGGQHQ